MKNSLEILSQKLVKEFVREKDQQLLNIIFTPNPTQKSLHDFLKTWDIEREGGHMSLMLAYFMKENPELRFSNYEKPRLEGLLRFYRFANAKVLAHFSKIGQKLNQAKIPVLLFKGGAMRALRPELPRIMGDVDIMVPPEKLKKAAAIAEALGYTRYNITKDGKLAAVDMLTPNKEYAVDIHCRTISLEPDSQNITAEIFARAAKVNVFGVKALIPVPEDLLFIVLLNLTKNITAKTSIHGVLYALFDCQYLLKSQPDFNWDIFISNVQKTKTQRQICLAVEFIKLLAPALLPHIAVEKFPFTREMHNYYNRIFFDDVYFTKLLAKSDAVPIKEILKKIIKSLPIKACYHLSKIIKRHQILTNLFLRLVFLFKKEQK